MSTFHRENPDSEECQRLDYENRRDVFAAKMQHKHEQETAMSTEPIAETPTPETDSQVFTATPESEDLEETMDVVTADFAKKLERQRDAARAELAYMKLQRDRLLEITWLDLPGEPHESTQRWAEEFAKGWVRR